jgi:hypothetical protein
MPALAERAGISSLGLFAVLLHNSRNSSMPGVPVHAFRVTKVSSDASLLTICRLPAEHDGVSPFPHCDGDVADLHNTQHSTADA